ncbi:MAG: hypothetical protein P1U87_05975 [Verrucomicrobiales bacterium]|nr:hypothetical protein [Verrucomicrobiales bacterium]
MSLAGFPLLGALEVPELLSGVGNHYLYYGLCALFFTLCGLGCGFFIWRKGYMQTLDTELEVKRTEEELKRMRVDLGAEERELRPEDESKELDQILDDHAGEQADPSS